jgi:outer membrane protein OmpA-like peptidoglycan-associated protein
MRLKVGWLVAITVAASGAAASPPVHVAYDAEHLDLARHVLQFKPSRPITDATLDVIADDGTKIDTAARSYDAAAAAAGWLSIEWRGPDPQHVMQLELHVRTADGAATKVTLVPWTVTIDHDDVKFRTDSAEIDPDERAKLDASVTTITEIIARTSGHMKVQLYVAGHTDTVGGAADNRKLSLARAAAIGAYFAAHGVRAPIVVAGFGEDVPKVKTRDNVDEPANRRADYVLGPAGAPPPFKGAYLAAKASWHLQK